MVKKSILFILIAFFLAGCNELESYKEDTLELWKNGAGDKYSIHMFTRNNSYSKESERIIKLNKYNKFDAVYSHRYYVGETNIDYLKAWGAKEYPFYLIVSKGGIKLKTTSVNDIEQFFEKNGGQILSKKSFNDEMKETIQEKQNNELEETNKEQQNLDYSIKNPHKTITKLDLFLENVNENKESSAEFITVFPNGNKLTRKLEYDGKNIKTKFLETPEDWLVCKKIEKRNDYERNLVIYHISRCNNGPQIIQINIPT